MPDITIHAADGGQFSAYLARPAAQGPFPGLVVIQEIFGVNDVMRGLCDQFAAQGYMAVCPDLFWRQEPGVQLTDKTDAEWQRASALMKGMDQDKAVADLRATLDHVRNHDDCTGRVGNVGYCLGGRLAFMMATRTSTDASVSYYGVGLQELLGEPVTQPLLLHIAENDRFVPVAARRQIVDALADNPNVTIHVYQGQDHAFARPGGAHYNEDAAGLADQRTNDFLRRYVLAR